jgi:hypothetical protein
MKIKTGISFQAGLQRKKSVQIPLEIKDFSDATNIARDESNNATELSDPTEEGPSDTVPTSFGHGDFALNDGVDRCHEQHVEFLIPTKVCQHVSSAFTF